MKKVLAAISCIGILLACGACRRETKDEKFQRDFKQFTQKECPKFVDQCTRLDSACYDIESRTLFYNYSVQGELDNDSIYTEVEAAKKFVELTGVDSLAVSIGTAHGKYKGTPVINFERLHELAAAVPVPLVLHGGSSSGDRNLERCATEGISKINIFTDFITAAHDSIAEELPDDWFKVLHVSDEAIKEVLRHYYHVFHCDK